MAISATVVHVAAQIVGSRRSSPSASIVAGRGAMNRGETPPGPVNQSHVPISAASSSNCSDRTFN